MARTNAFQVTFNRGRISQLGLARVDLDRTRLSAELQSNWIPRTLGSMMLRPGLQHIGQIRNNSAGVYAPFVFDNRDTALLEFTSTSLRVWVNDAVIERTGVSSSFVNGNFSSTLNSWTDADDSGSTSFATTDNQLGLVGTRYAYARRRQTVSVSTNDINTEHGIGVTVDRGLVSLRVGSSTGGDDYVSETVLRPGYYSFGVTPTSNIYVDISGNTEYASLVSEFAVESSGDMVLPTPWSSTDMENLRDDASADVTFMACAGVQQRRVERRATRSWGVAKYEPEDGPFRNPNITTKRLTPTGLTGDITLNADGAVFSTGHVGSLFQITSIGQKVTATISGENQWTGQIRVAGVENTRKFQYLVTQIGSTAGTVTIQRSDGEPGNWADVSGLSFTSTIDSTHDDGLDNQISFYRIGIGTGNYTGAGTTNSTDTAAVSLVYASGGLVGVARINAVFGATQSSASVLTAMGSTVATETWAEGDWSTYRGWPTEVRLHEGRLWWFGKGKIWGSVSDAFESFETEGDAGPINRSFGSGAVDSVPWAVSLSRLVIGAESREVQAKTNSLEEPLTPDNFALRDISNQGSTGVRAVKIDKRALFVQRGGVRVMETGISGNTLDYETADRTVLVPEIGEPGITRMAVQRQPDTRVHCVRSDGTVALHVSDPAENVSCWIDVDTDGAVEDVVVLPGTLEDSVYYLVNRTVGSSTVRYLEKWATEPHARGGSSNRMADSFVLFHSTDGSTTITGATHLAGETVCAWGSAGSGTFLGSTFVVSSTGGIQIPSTLAKDSTTVCYGKAYNGWFKSAKLAYAAQAGTALTQPKKIDHLGLIMANVHARGLQFGASTGSTLMDLPVMEQGDAVSTDTVHTAYDQKSIPFPGSWNTDSRIVLKGTAPKPVTVLGAVFTVETKERI